MTNKTLEQMTKDERSLKLVSQLGGYQVYQISNFDYLANPANLETVRANNKIKIIVTDNYYSERNIQELRELVINAMNNSYAGKINTKISVDDVIKNMEEFRKQNGPLCPFIDSEYTRLKNLDHPSGHDRHTANIRTHGLEKFLTVSNAAQRILLSSIPLNLVEERENQLRIACEFRACNNTYNGVHERAKNGELDNATLKTIAEKVNENILPQFEERLMTPEIVREYISYGLDYLPFEVARLKSQSAILHYLESRRVA